MCKVRIAAMPKRRVIMKYKRLFASLIASAVIVTPLTSFAAYAEEETQIVFNTWNTGGVGNGPSVETQFTPESDVYVYSIANYHWNYGSGSPVGTISVYEGETLIGEWEAVGSNGMGGVVDAVWTAYPSNLTLKAGHTYTFGDSDPDTWSCNSSSGNRGFVEVRAAKSTPAPEKQTFNGHEYQRFDTGMTWEEAKEYCESLGGHLATITSQEEQDAVASVISGGNMDVYWLGGTAYDCVPEWITGEEFVYNNFAESQPDNAYGGVHIEMQNVSMNGLPQYSWGDTDAAGEYFGLDRTGFVCEWDNEAPETDYPFIGKWKTFTDDKKTVGYFEFKEDHTLNVKVYTDGVLSDRAKNYDWYVENGAIYCGGPGHFYSVEGDKLTLSDIDGYTLTFERVNTQPLGDVVIDGKIDSKDATAILVEYSARATGGAPTLIEEALDAADANKDTKVDSKDASAILSYYSYTATGGKDSLEDFLFPKEK